METILNYLDSVFVHLPQTPEMEQLKRDMQLNMEEKYEELKNRGYSENEAIGTVLSEFGNIEEIIQEYGFQESNTTESALDKTVKWSYEEAEHFLHTRSVFGAGIGFGVSLCILAPAALFMAKLLFSLFGVNAGTVADTIGILLLLIFIAIGVGILVLLGIRESQSEAGKQTIFLSPPAREMVMRQREGFQSSFAAAISAGVVLCIAAPISLLLSISFLGRVGTETGLVFLLSFIALGVFLFIYYGITKNAFDQVLAIGDFTPEKQERERKSNAAAEVIFPLLGIGYVISGFLFDTWGTGWVVFPIAGLGFAAYEVILDGVENLKKKHK